MENNEKKEMLKRNFFEKNKWTVALGVISLILIGVNIYDKNNSSKIEVVVDSNLAKNFVSEQKMDKIKIFVYDSQMNTVQETEAEIPDKKEFLEGDYISEIIKRTPTLDEKMNFLSSYDLEIDGQNTVIVKLNSEFLEVKKNKTLYEGFVKSIADTLKLYNRNVQNVQVQIDGDAVVQ